MPKEWREGLKGDKQEPGNYKGITLLNVVGKVCCKIPNKSVKRGKEQCIYNEGQAGLERAEAAWITINEIVQGRLREDKRMYSFFKAYNTVWRDSLWLKLCDMGVKGTMRRVLKV